MATHSIVFNSLLEQSESLILRAESDPAFLKQLLGDPVGVIRATGLDLSGLLKHIVGVPAATDDELVEVLAARISSSQTMAGCGNCGARRRPRPRP